MTTTRTINAALAILLGCAVAVPLCAQRVDTVPTDSTAERLGLWARSTRSSGLILSSGKTYNRVEGLPVHIGPVFRDSSGRAAFNLSVLGIIRSADTFHWDAQNLGHTVSAQMRVGRDRGYALGLA